MAEIVKLLKKNTSGKIRNGLPKLSMYWYIKYLCTSQYFSVTKLHVQSQDILVRCLWVANAYFHLLCYLAVKPLPLLSDISVALCTPEDGRREMILFVQLNYNCIWPLQVPCRMKEVHVFFCLEKESFMALALLAHHAKAQGQSGQLINSQYALMIGTKTLCSAWIFKILSL